MELCGFEEGFGIVVDSGQKDNRSPRLGPWDRLLSKHLPTHALDIVDAGNSIVMLKAESGGTKRCWTDTNRNIVETTGPIRITQLRAVKDFIEFGRTP